MEQISGYLFIDTSQIKYKLAWMKWGWMKTKWAWDETTKLGQYWSPDSGDISPEIAHGARMLSWTKIFVGYQRQAPLGLNVLYASLWSFLVKTSDKARPGLFTFSVFQSRPGLRGPCRALLHTFLLLTKTAMHPTYVFEASNIL